MSRSTGIKLFTEPTVSKIPALSRLEERYLTEMSVVSRVLPFRVNNYVLDELIQWSNVPGDPLFRLFFPSRGMLSVEQYDSVSDAIATHDDELITKVIRSVRAELNPHPDDQQTTNVPLLRGQEIRGLQHKYRETILMFPPDAQTCHSYCSFCFRWPQFVKQEELRMALQNREMMLEYVENDRNISDVLVTGGDAMFMKTKRLRFYLEGFLDKKLDHVSSIRIGTKSLSFWPYRFLNEPDSADLLDLFRELISGGKHVALMAHYNHPRELETKPAQAAIAAVQASGAVIRSQGPILRGINDQASTWTELWRKQVRLGIVPYYMFVARDTGARSQFDLPLAAALEIYEEAVRSISGLGRTVRGPIMSAGPGKVEILGHQTVGSEDVFVLRLVQSRNPLWSHKVFYAQYSASASWFDELKPAFGQPNFFFQ